MSNWLKYSPISGHGNGTITITASTLSELEDRVATIVVSNSQYSLSASTSVTQKGAQLTAITFENLTWVTDVPATGGTATKDNCSYTVIGQYSNGTTGDITEYVTVSGSLNVSVSTEMTRQNVGNLTLTANYDGFSASSSVSAYQAAPSITGIGFTSLVWVNDVPASGGTATKDNCTYTVYAYYDTNMSTDITDVAVITGSLVVPATTATTRQNVGTLVLTASYDAFSATSSVTAYQIIYGADEYLTFEIISGGTIYFRRNNDSIRRITISYSKDDGETWTNFESSSSEVGVGISVQSGDVVLFKGDNARYCINIAPDRYYSFSGTTARFNIKGNIMSLINSSEFETISTLSSEYTFYHIFESCTGLTSAEHLILPAITLTSWCYTSMFNGCTSLTTAPILYAATLAGYCYSNMFQGCTSLTTAPELPATTLKTYCYAYMFEGCTSLTSVPELNATTLAVGCYQGMFENCTGITSVPSDYLPTIELPGFCYQIMFQGCTSLTSVPELPAMTLANNCYQGMFANCTSLTSAPALPATDLPQDCYFGMFSNCTSLTTAPVSIGTSASTLAHQCCTDMFQNCTSLTTAPELPSTSLATLCYSGMFNGCTSLTVAPELPATTLAERCYVNMFYGCTSLTTAPVSIGTSAATLAESCCHSMFERCKSLTTAPELPATTLAHECYNEMFYGCTSLNYIKCLSIHDSTIRYTDDWVYGVASSGTFVKAPNMNDWTTGLSGIPTDWIVVNYGLTGISISDLTWVIDIPSSGGTADKNNCSYSVYANYNNGTVIDITNQATVSGSLNVSASTVETRHSAGTLTLTASYSGFTDSNSIDVYQEANITDYSKEYLTLKIERDGVINWKTGSNSNKKTISYSKDNGVTWTNITSSTGGTKIFVSNGDKIKFKGDNESYNGNWLIEDYYLPFTVEGNIMSLIDSEGFATATTLTSANTFSSFFSSSDCTSAENLVLPATTLTDNCYQNMFANCELLTKAPELPATTLAQSCYYSMFKGCTSLTIAPALPATTSAQDCYREMFRGCTSLTTAPSVLPATILEPYCYRYMFEGCTSLTTAPELPATTLANNCYDSMFWNCTSLTTAPSALPATTLVQSCYMSMFKGCTSLITVPSVLPATTLAGACYNEMFADCTSLTTAPELPATTLASNCYYEMFRDCTKLNYIKCLATDISASYCTRSWVSGVASTGTFVKNPNMTSWRTGSDDIPRGWTVIDAT